MVVLREGTLNGLERIFLDKPELVTGLPDWMFTPAEREELAAASRPALAELAGRDSVAAALRAVEEEGLDHLVATAAYTGTEYGPLEEVFRAHARLRERLDPGVGLSGPILLGSPAWWRALNGRHLQSLSRAYGFSPVCPGCHMYFHALRLPLSLSLGGLPVIAGERESHDGRLKLNQLPRALSAYRELFEGFGARLLTPLSGVESGREVEEILGIPWPEGGEQLSCVFSGNYLDGGGGLPGEPPGLAAYFREFALPLTRRVVEAYLAGGKPDHLGLAKETAATLAGQWA